MESKHGTRNLQELGDRQRTTGPMGRMREKQIYKDKRQRLSLKFQISEVIFLHSLCVLSH